jgi:hypothetical protein
MTSPEQVAVPNDQDATTPRAPQGTTIRTIGILLYLTTLLAEMPGILLYLTTLLAEMPGMVARYLIIAFLFWLASSLNQLFVAILTLAQGFQQVPSPGFNTPPTPPGVSIGGGIIGFFNYLLSIAATVAPVVIFLVTIAPLVFSLVTFFLLGGFFFRRFALGARAKLQRTPGCRYRVALSLAWLSHSWSWKGRLPSLPE